MGLDKFISKGIDKEERLILAPRGLAKDANPFGLQLETRNVFYIEELENLEWDEIFLDLLKENSSKGLFARLKDVCCHKGKQEDPWYKRAMLCLCCFSWCSRFKKTSGLTPKEKAKVLIAMRQHLTSKSDLERVTSYFTKREQRVQQSREFEGPFFGNYTRQIL